MLFSIFSTVPVRSKSLARRNTQTGAAIAKVLAQEGKAFLFLGTLIWRLKFYFNFFLTETIRRRDTPAGDLLKQTRRRDTPAELPQPRRASVSFATVPLNVIKED